VGKVKWKRLRIAGVPFALHLPLVGLRAKQNGMPAAFCNVCYQGVFPDLYVTNCLVSFSYREKIIILIK
jgi:hypothetical protein